MSNGYLIVKNRPVRWWRFLSFDFPYTVYHLDYPGAQLPWARVVNVTQTVRGARKVIEKHKRQRPSYPREVVERIA